MSQSGSASLTTFEVVVRSSTLRPDSLMRARDGRFYGTSRTGGPAAGGAIFRVAGDGTLAILHAFSSRAPVSADGLGPVGPLVEIRDGEFLGIASGRPPRVSVSGAVGCT